MKKLFTSCCAVLLLALPASGDALRSIPLLRHGVIADGVGEAGFATADITGDGKPEVISCGAGAPFAVGAVGDSYGIVWRGPFVNCRSVTAGDRNRDGAVEVLVLGAPPGDVSTNMLLIFDPRTLGPARTSLALPGDPATDVALGNVDFENGIEIVVVNPDSTLVYDGATLDLQWDAAGYGGTRVELGDVDGDSRMEVVVNGSPASVLDAGNEVLKWGYVGGFGYYMALGNVDADSKAEIVFAPTWGYSITILNGDTFTTSTLDDYDSAIDGIAVVDANDDGVNEILTGNDQWGYIEGRRPADGTYAYRINNPEHGTQNVGAGDIDGDGLGEVFWGAGSSSSGDDALFLGDPKTQSIEWQSVDLDSNFHSAVGDLDQDGDLEYVVASSSSASGYSGGIIEIFDLKTGNSEGQLLRGNQHDLDIYQLEIGQLDADAPLEVLALGENWYDPTLVSWDGVSRTIEWSTSTDGFNGTGFSTDALMVRNVDGDAVDEILLGTDDSKLQVLNGASNIIQWTQTVSGHIVDLAAADLNGNGGIEVILGTTTGVYVLATSNWATLGSVAQVGVLAIAATAEDGGTVGVSVYNYPNSIIYTFHGATLVIDWNCLSQPGEVRALAFGTIDDALHLVAGNSQGALTAFPLAEELCPVPLKNLVGNTIHGVAVGDVTGDGRDDIMVDTYREAQIFAVALPDALSGDADSDGLITSDDIDAVADYLFDAGPGFSPAADANADGRIGVEDAFVLIHHEFAGGEAPQP